MILVFELPKYLKCKDKRAMDLQCLYQNRNLDQGHRLMFEWTFAKLCETTTAKKAAEQLVIDNDDTTLFQQYINNMWICVENGCISPVDRQQWKQQKTQLTLVQYAKWQAIKRFIDQCIGEGKQQLTTYILTNLESLVGVQHQQLLELMQ